MPRIRSVKPEFFGSEPVGNCSPTSRLLFIALWCLADDDGRTVDNPKIIRAFAFPLDDDIVSADVDHMLWELHAARLIQRYEFDGRKYLAVRNFREHQHPKKRIPSKLPAPEQGNLCVLSSPPVPHQFPTSGACSGSGRVEGVGVGDSVPSERAAVAAPALPLLLPEPKRPAKAAKPAKADASLNPQFPHFSQAFCREGYAVWLEKLGATDYGQFRKAFGPIFNIPEADRPAAMPRDAEWGAIIRLYGLAIRGTRAAQFTKPDACASRATELTAAAREPDPERRIFMARTAMGTVEEQRRLEKAVA